MPKDYDIAKISGQCCACGRALEAGAAFVATVHEADGELQRRDWCPACWQGRDADAQKAPLASWAARVPTPEQKKRTFVDDDVLVQFFERLDGTDEPARVSFRFVLALLLMRKKLLVYDGSGRRADGAEVWHMHFKGDEQSREVLDPHMDEQKIAEVTEQIGAILESEL